MADKLFKGFKVLIPKEQLPEHVEEVIMDFVEGQGGVVTANIKEATIVLLNPAAANYDEMRKQYKFWQENSDSQVVIAPYHYLYAVREAGEMFPVEQLKPAHPIFVHPDTGQPLRMYVSVNIEPAADDEPDAKAADVQSRLQRRLEAYGAVLETTRKGCDVGLFNMSPLMPGSIKFAKEVRAMGKLVAGRDWVESCIDSEELKWTDLADREDDDQDSMAEATPQPASASRGPGRPAGMVRKEYTAEEDDLLCRWLAYHKPSGSYASRKTYETMVNSEATYPWVTNHSYQSWHQRFKTNSNAFGTRVAKYIRAEIDNDLKTAKEREREREYRREVKRARPSGAVDEQTAHKKARVAEKPVEKPVEKLPVKRPAARTVTAEPPSPAEDRRSKDRISLENAQQAEAGPGPSSAAVATAQHALVVLSDDEDSTSASKSAQTAGQLPQSETEAAPVASEGAVPTHNALATLEEDDASTDAALFPSESNPAPPRQSSPRQSPSPVAEAQTQTGAETQAMLQHHQALRQTAARRLSPAPTTAEPQHISVAVNQQSPDGHLRLSLSTTGDTTVDIDIGRAQQSTPAPPKPYVRRPGSMRKLLLGPEASIEEIHSSGGSRRQSSVHPRSSLKHHHQPDLVLKATQSIRPSPIGPAVRLAAPVEPRPSTGTAEEGFRAMQETKARYREWVASMVNKYGVSGRDVAETTARISHAAAQRGGTETTRWNEIELELQKLRLSRRVM